jgi:drug/metabolite transporter (DMT)-like permease
MFGGGAFMATGVALLGTHQGLVGTLPAPAVGWLWMAGLLSVCFLVGNLALQYGAARLSAHTTALIMLSEVVFASVSSVVLGAASLTLQTVAGGSLILLAAVLASRAPSRPHS